VSTLSLCLIAKNEATTLPRLIKSFEGNYDEIILVDTGSTDDTVNIATELGAKVVHRPWDDNFSNARNAACELATSNWIICPDCDEVIKNPEELYRFLEQVPEAVNLVQIDLHTSWENYVDVDTKGKLLTLFPAQRCFRNKTHIWKDRVHEYLSPVAGTTQAMLYCHEAWLEHHPLVAKSRAFYLDLLRKQVCDGPNDGRHLYYMGRECMSHGLYVEAVGYFERCLQFHHWDFERCQTRIYLAECYKFLNQLDKTEDQLIMSLKEEPSRRDSAYQLGEFYREQQKWDKAIVWYRTAAALPKTANISYFTNESLYHALPFLRLAYCYWQVNNIKEALHFYQLAAKDDPENPEVIQNAPIFELPRVSVIIPTRFRDGSLNRVISMIRADEASYPNIDVIVIRDEGKKAKGCPKSVNEGLKRCKTDYVAFLGNDTYPRPGWLLHAMLMMKQFPNGKGMIGFNNMYSAGMAQHFVIHKDILQQLDYNKDKTAEDTQLFNEDYTHNFVDDDLRLQVEALGRYRWCSRAIVEHSWHLKEGTSPSVALRPADECDQRAATAFSEDHRHFMERFNAAHWGDKRELTFGVQIMARKEANYFLKDVIENVLEVFPKENIVGVLGPQMATPITDDDADDETKTVFDTYGIRTLWCVEPTEAERRNYATKILDTDYVFIIDADELWDKDDLQKAISMLKANPQVELLRTRCYTYWKTPDWRITPPEPLHPTVAIKRTVNFTQCRNTDAQIVQDAPDMYFHHFSYVGDDARIQRKIELLSRADAKDMHPVIETWYNNVWKAWTPETSENFENLHPTHPEAYKKAVKDPCPLSLRYYK